MIMIYVKSLMIIIRVSIMNLHILLRKHIMKVSFNIDDWKE